MPKKNVDKWEKQKKEAAKDDKRGIRGGRPKSHDKTAEPVHPSTLPQGQKVTDLRVDGDIDLSIFDDLEPDQDFMIMPTAPDQDQVYTVNFDPVSGAQVVQAVDSTTLAVTVDYSTIDSDGGTPSKPDVTVTSGPGFIVARWSASTGTSDPVLYQVFVREGSAPTTADATYLVATTPALTLVIDALKAGTQLNTSSTYYVIVKAYSAKSLIASTVSDTDTATPGVIDGTITLIQNLLAGQITAGDIASARMTTNFLTAAQATVTELSAIVANMGSITSGSIVVGNPLAGHGELDQYGFRSYQADGVSKTLNVDFQTGDLTTYGNLNFGSSFSAPSRLTSEDYMEMQGKAAAGTYKTIIRVQTAQTNSTASTVTITPSAPTTQGNTLIVVVTTLKAGGAPTVTTPAGWTATTDSPVTNGDMKQYLFYRIGAPSISSLMLTLSGTSDRTVVQFAEYSGITVADQQESSSGTSTSMSPGTTGSTGAASGQTELVFVGSSIDISSLGASTTVGSGVTGYTGFNHFTYVTGTIKLQCLMWTKTISSNGAQTKTTSLSNSLPWIEQIVTFKAEAFSSSPISVPTDFSGRLFFKTEYIDDIVKNPGTGQTGSLYNGNDTHPFVIDDWDDGGNLHPLVLPRGAMLPYAARYAPTGFLMCDGSAVSRTTYGGLLDTIMPVIDIFTVTIASPGVFTTVNNHGLISGDPVVFHTSGALPTGLTADTVTYYVIATGLTATSFQVSTSIGGSAVNTSGSQSGTHSLFFCPYGPGDGSTTFNVPDSRGRFLHHDPRGAAKGTQIGTLGRQWGNFTKTLGTANLPVHNHSISASGTHTHTAGTLATGSQNTTVADGQGGTLYRASGAGGLGAGSTVFARQGGSTQQLIAENHTHSVTGSTAAGGDHDHGGVTGDTGSATPIELPPPTLNVTYIIKY